MPLAPNHPKTRAPDDGLEELEIHTADGVALRADVREPRKGSRLVGVAVLAHAMFARRTEFARPKGEGLARFLSERGFRTIAFDFRGHGDSKPGPSKGGDFSYDELVRQDLPAVVACARARSRNVPVSVLGHSLGGHVALASQGLGLLGADAIVCIAASVWLPELEPSRLMRLVKRAVVLPSRLITDSRGSFPARVLRQGSDDISRACFDAILRNVERGYWRSDDFRDDYLSALRRVRVPVLGIVSDGDHLQARPAAARALLAHTAGPVDVVHVRRADDGGRPPGHMELVTTPAVTSAWTRAAEHMASARPSRPASALS